VTESTLLGCDVLDEVEYGGIGKVVRARDPDQGREFAFRRLPPALLQDGPRLERLVEGCRRAGELHHPNLAQNLGLREERGVRYVGLSFHPGDRLVDLIARQPLPPVRAVDLALQLASALARIHDRGWTHGDVRPVDVIVDARGHLVVLDFGLATLREPARVTDALAPPGERTPPELIRWAPFMSPEQAQGQELDYRSDIFSLGAAFYAMLTGSPPFQRGTGSESLSALLRDPTPRLAEKLGTDVREMSALQQIVDRSLARALPERYLLLQPSRAFRRESWDEPSGSHSLDEDLRAVRRALSRPEAPPRAAGCLGRAALLALAGFGALASFLG
jgi:serine/threonine-protein kinase